MKSNVESGINTYVGNFNKLISACESFGTGYNPVPPNLQIPTLKGQSQIIQSAINHVDDILSISINVENDRQQAFSILPAIATRVQAIAIVSGVPDAVLVHVKEIVRKIRGQRAHKIKIEPLEENSQKHISVSQVSFNEQIEHLNQLISLLKHQPAYTPAEPDLTIQALDQMYVNMQSTNDRFVEIEATLTTARQERNKLLYAPKTGMMDTALAVKEYVKAAFGATSPQYKEVKHISFRNKKI